MLQTKIKDDLLEIKVLRDIHFENFPQLEMELEEFKLPENIRHIIIDFSNVTFIDSTGISFLVKWLHPLKDRMTLQFNGVREPVKKILSICKIDQFVEVN